LVSGLRLFSWLFLDFFFRFDFDKNSQERPYERPFFKCPAHQIGKK
jgi:hypothetical protein